MTYEGRRETIVLKARQLGMTELTAAFALFKMVHHSHYTVIVLSKGQDEASEFLSKARTAYDHLPTGRKPALKNATRTSTLELNNGSRMIPLPSTTSAGRSYSAQLLILDEMAHQAHQQETYLAAAPIARSAGNKIIMLSTANGDGNFFSKMWHYAVEAQHEGQAEAPHPIFLPWSVRPGRDALWYKQATAGLET
jgi:hypothetical protein